MIKIKHNNVTYEKSNSSLQTKELFATPIYEKYYGKHEEFKHTVINYLKDDTIYNRNTHRQTLKFTHPNLHKEPLFKPIVEFLHETISEVFIDLGFVPNFELTGLWATRQSVSGGYHHRHIHHNSFISGVYYLNGSENTIGTTFFSSSIEEVIRPAVLDESSMKIRYNHTTTFEEGKAVVFPAILQHSTGFNPADSDRIILSYNCMPIGKTNTDPFERYNYQSIENADVISYNDERYK